MILRYARIGGRVQPPDNEGLQVEDDGTFSMWRSIAPAVGRFAGKVPANEFESLRREAETAASEGDLASQPTMDGSAERIEVNGATATMGSNDYVEGGWGDLITHVRRLLDELVENPEAAVGLEVGTDGRNANLVHLGQKPLSVDLSKLSVRAVLWGKGFTKLGDWFSPQQSPSSQPQQTQTSNSWKSPLPFEHGLEPGRNKILHVYVTFAVSENGQRADVMAQHTPPVPA